MLLKIQPPVPSLPTIKEESLIRSHRPEVVKTVVPATRKKSAANPILSNMTIVKSNAMDIYIMTATLLNPGVDYGLGCYSNKSLKKEISVIISP